MHRILSFVGVLLLPLVGEASEARSSHRGLGVGDTRSREFTVTLGETTQLELAPTLWFATSAVTFIPNQQTNPESAIRFSTLGVSRFGAQGRLSTGDDWAIEFKAEYERNLGFLSGPAGPVGTAVFEGLASLQTRENYLRLVLPVADKLWDLELTAGIVTDPASVDFVADTALDLFGTDPFVRDPLLLSGFNQAQGFLLRNEVHFGEWGTLGVGQHLSSGNPLQTSLSLSFGGEVSAFGTLFGAPLGATGANSVTSSPIHLTTYSPSLDFRSAHLDVAVAAQFYWVDADFNLEEDFRLGGRNFRATAQSTLADDAIRVFAGLSDRSNEQLLVIDRAVQADDDYTASTWYFGTEVNVTGLLNPERRSVLVGFQWNHFENDNGAGTSSANFLNIGVRVSLFDDWLQAGGRYARLTSSSEGEASVVTPLAPESDTVFLTLQLRI
ncbi:MAG: hypothetical protein AAFX94_00165 [Myxococcota bacterium]